MLFEVDLFCDCFGERVFIGFLWSEYSVSEWDFINLSEQDSCFAVQLCVRVIPQTTK